MLCLSPLLLAIVLIKKYDLLHILDLVAEKLHNRHCALNLKGVDDRSVTRLFLLTKQAQPSLF